MKVSFITTVYNEELTIKSLLESLFSQSKFPDEIIIVDGGSTDNTVAAISNFKFPPLRQGFAGQATSNSNAKIKLIFKKGNRSVGRNEAIGKSGNEIIVCSDSGCSLDKDWVKNITEPFKNSKVDVVAGYYKGNPKTIFEKCLIPYVLVMPDRIDKNHFLPATRSMAFKKTIWKKAGRFPERFSDNEDYVFAKNLEKISANIVFKKDAIVYWLPRKNMKEAFVMFYRFAKGDSESRIFRPKVMLIFLRYLIVLFFIIFFLTFKSYIMLNVLCLTLIIYVLWSIIKNYKYVNDFRAIFYLPLIQFVSDNAVIMGTIGGFSFVKNKNGR